jgi:cytochrome c oxidase cbb3-type subunit I/II
MLDPESMSPNSIMPPYPWLFEKDIDKASTPTKIAAMQTLGVPYAAGFAEASIADLESQAKQIAASLKEQGFEVSSDKQIVALIAYLQRLGTDIKGEKTKVGNASTAEN